MAEKQGSGSSARGRIVPMQAESYDVLREELEKKKAELTLRLERITNNLRRGYHPDSKERAKELEDSEVVDAGSW